MIRVRVRLKPDRRCYQLWYLDPFTGLEKTRSAKTDHAGAAQRAAALWEQEINSGTAQGAGITWEQFRMRFIDEHLVHLRVSSRRSYTTSLNVFESLAGKPRNVRLITPTVISQAAAAMIAAGGSKSYVARVIRHVRSALSWAHKMGILAAVPVVALPELRGHEKSKGRPLTDEEFTAMIAATERVRPHDFANYKHLLRVLDLSGLRLGEALQLAWGSGPVQVDLEDPARPFFRFCSDGQKSRKMEIVPMTPDFAKFLLRTPAGQRVGLICPGISKDAGHILTAIGESAGVVVNDQGKFASAHDLRRRFATRWAGRVRPLLLKKLMRHSSIATTLKYYVDQSLGDYGRELAAWKNETVPEMYRNGASGKEKACHAPPKTAGKTAVPGRSKRRERT